MAFIVFNSAINLANGVAWIPSDIPSPIDNPQFCGRGNSSSYICNPESIISDETADWFDQTVSTFREETTNVECGSGTAGYQIASLWVNDIQMLNGESEETAAERFASEVHNLWGVGDARCDNGVLIFVTIGLRQIYISAGQKIHEVIGDNGIKSIITEMQNPMRDDNYNEGLRIGTNEVISQLNSGGSGGLSNDAKIVLGVVGGILGIIIIGACCLYCYNDSSHDRKIHAQQSSSKVKKALKKINEEYEHNKDQNPEDFQQIICPICLEDYGEDTKRLQCKHLFCTKCINQWFEKSKSCPVCRNTQRCINSKQLTKHKLNELSKQYPDHVNSSKIRKWNGDSNIMDMFLIVAILASPPSHTSHYSRPSNHSTFGGYGGGGGFSGMSFGGGGGGHGGGGGF